MDIATASSCSQFFEPIDGIDSITPNSDQPTERLRGEKEVLRLPSMLAEAATGINASATALHGFYNGPDEVKSPL